MLFLALHLKAFEKLSWKASSLTPKLDPVSSERSFLGSFLRGCSKAQPFLGSSAPPTMACTLHGAGRPTPTCALAPASSAFNIPCWAVAENTQQTHIKNAL